MRSPRQSILTVILMALAAIAILIVGLAPLRDATRAHETPSATLGESATPTGRASDARPTKPPARPAESDPTPTLEGIVFNVIDGDTVDVRLASGPIRVRLHAIDTPERGQPYYAEATRALAQMVSGKSVQLEPYVQDRYERMVGRLWRGDLDVNAEMIRLGHAWAYRRYLDDAAYCRYETSARDHKRGLWKLPPEDRIAPWEWRRRKSLDGKFTDYARASTAGCIAAMER